VDSQRPTELWSDGAGMVAGAIAGASMSGLPEQLGLPDAPWLVDGAAQIETRLLLITDLDALERVHHDIVGRAPLGTVALETTEFLAGHLGAEGHTVGLFVEGQLIAYGILGLSGTAHERLAKLLGLSAQERKRLAVLDGVGVLPAFRGHGAHGYLSHVREALASRHGRPLLAASAAPANSVSWRNLMRLGLEVRALARMFGGHWRYLMLRDDSYVPADVPAEFVDALSIEHQQRLLDHGCRGVRPGRQRNRATVGYVAGVFAQPRDRPSR
jgi:hypothetical protein